MAKFVQSAFLGEIRNKAGDKVFSRNRYGPFMRGYAVPDNTVTPARETAQLRWAAACSSWEDDLTDIDRQGWESLARGLRARPGPCGGRKQSGRQMFIASYCNLDNIGVTPLIRPPNAPVAGQLHSLTATCDADAHSLLLDASEGTDPPNQGLVIFASPLLSPARYTARDLWRQLGSVAPNPTFPLEIWTEYETLWGTPTPGAVIIFGVSPIAAVTGIAGTRQTARCIVTGTGDAMLTRKILVTATQMKDLIANPVELIPAPGPGKVLVLLELFAILIYTTTPYNANGAQIIPSYATEPTFAGNLLSDPDLIALGLCDGSAADVIGFRLRKETADNVKYRTTAENQPITLHNINATDMINGDSDLLFTLTYSICETA